MQSVVKYTFVHSPKIHCTSSCYFRTLFIVAPVNGISRIKLITNFWIKVFIPSKEALKTLLLRGSISCGCGLCLLFIFASIMEFINNSYLSISSASDCITTNIQTGIYETAFKIKDESKHFYYLFVCKLKLNLFDSYMQHGNNLVGLVGS